MIGIWGIVNITPDSFSDGGRFFSHERAVEHGRELLAAGATVLDIGGESTRPGAKRVSLAEEQARVLPVIEQLAADGAVLSIDTMNAATAVSAVAAGVRYVNDVSGGQADPEMLAAVAGTDAQFAVGHWRGPSADMYAQAQYERIGSEVAVDLTMRVELALAAGIDSSRLVLDPGIGFAKTGPQNWAMLRELESIVGLGYRVLVGTSRKRFLLSALREEPGEGERDLATAVTSVLAAQAGAWAVRVHNAGATRDALAVLDAWNDGTHG